MTTIYIAFDHEGQPLYVGQTARRDDRLYQHYARAEWWRLASSIDLIHLPPTADAVALESLLIYELKPLYNSARGARPSERGLALLADILRRADLGPRGGDGSGPRPDWRQRLGLEA